MIADHLDIWTAAPVSKANGGRGRVSAANRSPYGIKKLRELILELAVRGMLVEQNPNDDPASVLLEKIAKEKARLIKEGKIKKQKPLPKIREEEKPYELPTNWNWVRLGDLILDIAGGGTPSRNNSAFWGGEIPWASVKDVGKTKFLNSTIDKITVEGLENSSSNLIPKGCVIVCTRMGLGKISINFIDVAINQDLKALRFPENIDINYFYNFFLTQDVKGTGMTVAGIRQDDLLNIPVQLPPLAEQHRIVAKVDELMALCDRLEQQQGDSSATHQTLVETLLATLTTAADHQGFAEAWHRIAGHFDTLFTTEESIDQLKQAILQLAVQGKLIPQDPNDEPASVLLTKIAKEGKLKKQKSLPEISEDDIPHAIPTNWSWAYFQNVTALITDGEHATPPRVSLAGIPMATAKNIRDGFIDLRDTDFVSEETARKCWKRCRPEHDDILMVCVGATTGRLTVIKEPEKFIMVRSVALIRPFSPHILPEYLALSLRSPIGQKQIWENVRQSAQPCLYIGKMNELQVSIPPLAEQHRIVAKVDDLMALCDQLKAKLTQSQERSEKLVDAMFQQLLVA
ncbi:MAG: restriction endonuclease subunit S [Desulfurivibrionaceae bacterium]